jgi:hypothetical protein
MAAIHDCWAREVQNGACDFKYDCPYTPSHLGTELCKNWSWEDCGICPVDVDTANVVGGALRDDVIQAAFKCMGLGTCLEAEECLSAWQGQAL